MKQSLIKVMLLLVFMNYLNVLFSQDRADSLKALLKEVTKEEKVDILLGLSKTTDPESEDGISYIDQAYQLAERLGLANKKAEALYYKGQLFSDRYKDSMAIIYYKQALKLKNKVTEQQGVIQLFNGIGESYYEIDNYEQAKEYFELAHDIVENASNTKEKANTFYNLGKVYAKIGEFRTALRYYHQAIETYQAINDQQGVAKAMNTIGVVYFRMDKYDSAIYSYNKTLKLQKEIKDKYGMGLTLNNMGNVYWRWSNYDSAITYYQKALRIFEEVNFKKGISTCLNNIGLIYDNLEKEGLYSENLKNYRKALEFHKKALETRRAINDELEEANSLNNIGVVNLKMLENHFESNFGKGWTDSISPVELDTLPYFINAMNSFKTALQKYEEVDHKTGLAQVLNNIGILHKYKRNYQKALSSLNESLEICKRIDDHYQKSLNLFEIGDIYSKKGQYNKALEYYHQTLNIAKELNNKQMKKWAYQGMSEVYELRGETGNALSYYKRYIGVRDTIFNERNYKTMQELQTKYETEKKELQLNQMQEKDKLKNKVIRNQKLLIIMFIIVFAVVAGFIVLIIKQNKKITRANVQLEEQKNLITKQKQEITDSIHYASRIQQAVLTPVDIINNLLTEYYIFYKPCHIVSGDFYWIQEKGGKVMVCAADCTGHGVPGAFMSMLGVSFLNEIISKHKYLHANEILEDLRDHVIKSLHQTKQGESREGMDLSFYILDRNEMKLEYAGANNPLIIVRDGEIIEYKGTKAPIGIHFKENEPFKNHVIDVKQGDCFYTFSDGYHDQFGGKKGKKFMLTSLRNIFSSNYKKSMKEQKEILENTMKQWMGEYYEQIDDMLVIGVRV